MKTKSCPECGKKHRKFPKACYYSVHADYVHVVIAKLASLGNSEQHVWGNTVQSKWELMKEYVLSEFQYTHKQ